MIDAEAYGISDLSAILYDALVPGQEVPPDPPEQTDLMWLTVSLARPMDGYWLLAQDNWETSLDPTATPAEALRWLAQFPGVRVEEAWTDDQLRDAIARPTGWARGTPTALFDAGKRTLTGSQYMVMVERFGGNAYHLFMRSLISETPDEDATRAAILAEKPAGIVLDYAATDSQTFFQLDTNYASFADVDTAYASFTELQSDV